MNSYFCNECNMCSSLSEKIRGNIPSVILVYFGAVLIHFASSNIYPSICCPMTFWGFIRAPFMVVTPHCEGLRWIIHYTGEQIRNVWVWLGGYLVWYVGNRITPFINTFRTNNYSNNKTNTDEVEPTNDASNIIEPENEVNEYNNNNNNNIRRRTRNNNYNN